MDGSAEQDSEVPWHAVETAAEVVEELVSSTTQGLSQAEAARRCEGERGVEGDSQQAPAYMFGRLALR